LYRSAVWYAGMIMDDTRASLMGIMIDKLLIISYISCSTR